MMTIFAIGVSFYARIWKKSRFDQITKIHFLLAFSTNLKRLNKNSAEFAENYWASELKDFLFENEHPTSLGCSVRGLSD